jgi:flagellar motor switch protein FliM
MDAPGISPSAKPLSLDAIRSKADAPTNNLVLLPKAFGRFSVVLAKNTSDIAATAPNFAFEGFCRTEAQPVQEADEGSCLTELLICGDVGQSVRVSVDRATIFGLCDAVFGGVGNEPAYSEARPFSRTERAIVQLFFKIFGRSLPSAFSSIALKEFIVAPPQDPNEDPVNPPFKSFVSVKILCNIFDYSGELTIELPEELALFFRPADDKRRGPKTPKISEWGAQISGRVEGIEMELVAVLAEFQMSLDRIADLHPGQVIELGNSNASPLTVCSEGIGLFTAKLGQTSGKFCLSIETLVSAPQ